MLKQVVSSAAVIAAGFFVGMPSPAHAASISVNFALFDTSSSGYKSADANSVDADELAVTGFPGR